MYVCTKTDLQKKQIQIFLQSSPTSLLFFCKSLQISPISLLSAFTTLYYVIMRWAAQASTLLIFIIVSVPVLQFAILNLLFAVCFHLIRSI